MEPGASTGYCACPFLQVEHATCLPKQLGMTVFPSFGKVCLLTTAVTARSSMVYSINSDNALTTPCVSLLSKSTICVDAGNEGYLVMAYVSHTDRNRHLLGMHTEHVTQSAICTDALKGDNMPTVKAECVNAYQSSLSSLRELNLTGLSPCSLCSMEDFVLALKSHPRELIRVGLQPRQVMMILLRHSPLRHTVSVWFRLRESAEVLALEMTEMIKEYEAGRSNAPPLFVRFLKAMGVHRQRNLTWTHRTRYDFVDSKHMNTSTAARSLLGVGVYTTIDTAFTQMMNIHDSYSSRINTGWSLDYPNLVETSDGQRPWVVDIWPPFGESYDVGTCNTLGDAAQIVITGVSTTATAITLRVEPPQSPLTLQWITLHDAQYASKSIEYNDNDDWVVRNIVWICKQIMKFLGVQPDTIYNIIYSIIQEAKTLIRCDFEALQTCSKWKFRIVPGMIIVGVIMASVILLLFAVSLPMVGIFVSFLYVPCVLYLCYGFAPTCMATGLVPVCLLQDVIQTLQTLLPSFILLPSSLLRPGCSMQEDSLLIKGNCIVPCSEQPFEFQDWSAVLAWCVAELGDTSVEWVDSAIQYVPFVDKDFVREQLWTKRGVYKYGGTSLISGHRFCAILSSYKALPYLLILLFLVVLVFVITALLLDLTFTALVVVCTLIVTVLFD